jgi:hypothetical protein
VANFTRRSPVRFYRFVERDLLTCILQVRFWCEQKMAAMRAAAAFFIVGDQELKEPGSTPDRNASRA